MREQGFQAGETAGFGQEIDEGQGGKKGGGLLAGARATELGKLSAGW